MNQLGQPTGFKAIVSRHKKLIIIGSIVTVILVTIGLYCWWSMTTWTAVESKTQTAKQEVRTYLEKAASLPVSTSDEKAKKLATLEGVEKQITSYKEICTISSLVEWQRAIDTFKRQQDDCRDTLAEFEAFKPRLKAIIDYLRDDQTIAALVVVAAGMATTELDETSWQETAAKWHVLAEKTKSLKVSSRFEPVAKRIVIESEHMDASWQEVIAAHTAKDRARYEKAKDELSKAYGTFKDATQLSSATILPLQQEFQTKYDQLTS